MCHIHPITHFTAQVFPLGRVLHNVLAAVVVVFFNGYGLTYVFFRYTQFLFHPEFNGQSVCVPAGLAGHAEAFHRLVAAHGVFYRASQNVVYSRMSVRRWRAFVESILRMAFALRYASFLDVVAVPLCKDFLVYLG